VRGRKLRLHHEAEVRGVVDLLVTELDHLLGASLDGRASDHRLQDSIDRLAKRLDQHRLTLIDRLLKRVDELCTRLVEVDGAMATKEDTPKITEEWKALVGRIEETEKRSSDLQTQIQQRLTEMSKVVELVSKLSKEAAGGNQE